MLCHVSRLRWHRKPVENRRAGKTKLDGKKARRRCAARRGNARSVLHMFHQIIRIDPDGEASGNYRSYPQPGSRLATSPTQ